MTDDNNTPALWMNPMNCWQQWATVFYSDIHGRPTKLPEDWWDRTVKVLQLKPLTITKRL